MKAKGKRVKAIRDKYSLMAEADTRRIEGLLESLIKRSGILGAAIHGWAEDGTVRMLEVTDTSARVLCHYPAYKVLVEGLKPRHHLKESRLQKFQKEMLYPAFLIAVEIIRLLFYEVSERNFDTVRVDVYAPFWVSEDRSSVRCILTTAATRQEADTVLWSRSNMSEHPDGILAHFQTRYNRGKDGEIYPIELDDKPTRHKPLQSPAMYWRSE